ncbi:hypothetical protein [Methylobacterium oryzihabitans]|uniref:Uncharacterized protein n=1 Tax=Methylobacterium oryzihabitans TaxID=2499852 RepID=A0A437P3B7_9HYPH|nr:hypothetical protein [Methylobacterium oryzihabitans]RVU16618.1 hypothetical protein EOE48_16215 [Methylobacterium oryzihabitans]
MPSPVDSRTVLALLRRANEKVRLSVSRADRAEARARALALQARGMLERVETALGDSALRVETAERERDDAVVRLAGEQDRLRILEDRLAAAHGAVSAAAEQTALAETRARDAEARLARVRAALWDGEEAAGEGAGAPAAAAPTSLH